MVFLEDCISCKKKAVDWLSVSESASWFGQKFMPHNLFGLIYGVKCIRYMCYVATAYSKTGSLRKCKSCGAYHLDCHCCGKISLLKSRPAPFDELICQHCSKTILISN